MKYICIYLFIIIYLISLTACGTMTDSDEMQRPIDYETMMEIVIKIDGQKLNGVLFKNEMAKFFSNMLPMTVKLWDPAPGFARAFDLDMQITDRDELTRSYELGGLAYWSSGPSIAVFFSDHLERTIVPVVPIGRIDGDVSMFAEYQGDITIEKKERSFENE